MFKMVSFDLHFENMNWKKYASKTWKTQGYIVLIKGRDSYNFSLGFDSTECGTVTDNWVK